MSGQTIEKKNDSSRSVGAAGENRAAEYLRAHGFVIIGRNWRTRSGEIDIIDASAVQGASFSTHMMPINIFIDYLLNDFECDIMIIGIQPENLEFGLEITENIKKSADAVIKTIADSFLKLK